MNTIAPIIFFVISSVLALGISCWGVEMIKNEPLGWVLFTIGTSYPSGIILYHKSHHKFINHF